ncbi:MAG: DUF4249 family protein, partial [Draconibacterium sp.]|nr:DUF4249 family protein [Draconibacterium sp.]
MKNSFIYILSVVTVLSSFLFTSCEDVVEVELNSEDLGLVSVEAYLNTRPNDNIFVKVEKTLPVDNPSINPAISNALVEISDNQATPNQVTLDEVGNSGIYKLPTNVKYDAIPGRTYELKITTPDGVVIKASEMLQKVEKLDTVKIHLSARGNFEFLAIFINSKETSGLGNYYKWDIYKNDKHLNDIENQPFASDELVDGNYIYDFEIFTDFQNPH